MYIREIHFSKQTINYYFIRIKRRNNYPNRSTGKLITQHLEIEAYSILFSNSITYAVVVDFVTFRSRLSVTFRYISKFSFPWKFGFSFTVQSTRSSLFRLYHRYTSFTHSFITYCSLDLCSSHVLLSYVIASYPSPPISVRPFFVFYRFAFNSCPWFAPS